MNTRPGVDEYLPAAEQYISLVPEGNLFNILQDQHRKTLEFLRNLTEEKAGYRYAEGKWSVKSIIGHIADVERLWNYRLLRIARGDAREFAGYDRDLFVRNACCDELTMAEVLNDYSAVRQATLSLLANLKGPAFTRRGQFNGQPLSARAAAFIIAGHETHHINVIKSKYFTS